MLLASFYYIAEVFAHRLNYVFNYIEISNVTNKLYTKYDIR